MKALLSDIGLPFAVILFCLAGFFFYLASQQSAHVRELTGEGRIAVATLVNKTQSTSSGIHKYAHFGDKGPTTYTMHYRFTVSETGEQTEASSNVHPDVWNAVQVGQQYQIIYSPKNPAVTSLFNGQDYIAGARLAYRIAWVCLILGVVSAGFFWKTKS